MNTYLIRVFPNNQYKSDQNLGFLSPSQRIHPTSEFRLSTTDLEKQETQEIEQKSYNKTLEILIFDREKSSRIRYDTVWVL